MTGTRGHLRKTPAPARTERGQKELTVRIDTNPPEQSIEPPEPRTRFERDPDMQRDERIDHEREARASRREAINSYFNSPMAPVMDSIEKLLTSARKLIVAACEAAGFQRPWVVVSMVAGWGNHGARNEPVKMSRCVNLLVSYNGVDAVGESISMDIRDPGFLNMLDHKITLIVANLSERRDYENFKKSRAAQARADAMAASFPHMAETDQLDGGR